MKGKLISLHIGGINTVTARGKGTPWLLAKQSNLPALFLFCHLLNEGCSTESHYLKLATLPPFPPDLSLPFPPTLPYPALLFPSHLITTLHPSLSPISLPLHIW